MVTRIGVTIDVQIVHFCAHRLLGLQPTQEVVAYNFDELAVNDIKARTKLARAQLSSFPVRFIINVLIIYPESCRIASIGQSL